MKAIRWGGVVLSLWACFSPTKIAWPSPEKQGMVKLEEGLYVGFLWPLRGETSSNYGKRIDPISADIVRHHSGVDLAAPRGAWVAASRAGQVSFAGSR
jgi:murein DD-endopeptidase MepM/ murein hydrolase activator NlpD